MLNMLQIVYQNTIRFAEVKFFFIKIFGGEPTALALVSLYTPAEEYFLHLTHDTLIVCGYRGEQDLVVVHIKSILSVVAAVPFPPLADTHYMIEKIGLDVINTEDDDDEE